MADAVDEPTEAFDPIKELARSHMARMQEIADENFDNVKGACNDVVQRLKRNVGLKDAVLDKTLTALGVTQPGEKDDAAIR